MWLEQTLDKSYNMEYELKQTESALTLNTIYII